MTRIPLSDRGRALLDIYILPLNGRVLAPAEFKVDTGSDVTTISKSTLNRLGYDADWISQNAVVFTESEKPTTASGDKVNAGIVRLPLINILGYEGKSWPFQIILSENSDFRNLLGRDLLAGFNFCFDNDDDVFSIKMAKAFRPKYQFLPGQEINEVDKNDR